MFKSLDPGDISIKKFKIFKTWHCDNTNYSSLGIFIQDGVRDNSFFSYNDSKNLDGSYKKLVWNSINNLYYASGNNSEFDYFRNYIEKSKLMYVSRSLDYGIRVINIPRKKTGYRINPGSVIIYEYSSSKYLVDDGNYNLYVSGTFPRQVVGNIFYDTGHIIITSQSFTSSLDQFSLSYQSSIEITEMEIICSILESEFNYTTNLTALKLDENQNYTSYYIDEFVSSSLKPLITTIGFYDDDNDLLMIAKFGKPYNRNYDLDTAFLVRIDL